MVEFLKSSVHWIWTRHPYLHENAAGVAAHSELQMQRELKIRD